MKLKALVLIIGSGVLAAMILFAAALPAPSRADVLALRETFFSRLGEWIGGKAIHNGPVRLKGFLNMKLEAENVEIKGAQRHGVTLRFKVGKLIARLNWLDVMMGRPNFRSLTLENVTVAADAPLAFEDGSQGVTGPSQLAGLASLFDAGRPGADDRPGPFAWVQIIDARVTFVSRSLVSKSPVSTSPRGARKRAHPLLKIADMQIKFGSGGSQEFGGHIRWRNQAFSLSGRKGAPGDGLAGSPLDLNMEGKLFTLTASGELASGPEQEPQFKGEVNAASSDFAAAARWLKIGLPAGFEAAGEAASASGRVTWKKHELSINGLEAGLNGRSLSGALSVKDRTAGRGGSARLVVDGTRLAVDGTLALSDFDVSALKGFALDEDGGASQGLAGVLRAADADLRISVNRLSFSGVPGASAAFTLLVKDGRLSADMADMAVLGGRVRGHFGLDASRPQRRLAVRATGADLDSAQLSRAFNAPGWLTGGASVNVEAQAEGRDWPGLLQSLNGEANVSFSEGGGVGLDLVGLAGGNGAGRRETQDAGRRNWMGRGSMKFDTLRAELAIDHGRIRSKSFELSTGGKAVAGRCIVDLPGQSIDWRFDVRPAQALGMGGTPGSGDALASGDVASSVTIKGPWRNPSIRVGEPGAELDWPTGARTHLPEPAPNG